MLSQAFTEMPKEVWECAPAITNAVDSKQRHVVNLKEAMTRLYTVDKSFCLKYIAGSENIRLSYTNATLKSNLQRKQISCKSKEYHKINLLCMDHQIRLQISKVARGSVRQKIVASHHLQRKQ